MKVYIVEVNDGSYYGTQLAGVFSTEEKAKEYMEKYDKYSGIVYELIVDEEIDPYK